MADGPIQGLTIGLGLDSTGLVQGLKEAKNSLKLANSEMAANMSAFDRGEKSVAKYQTQLTGLNRKLDAQKAAVSASRAEYDRMVATHGENSRQARNAAAAYNTQVAAANNLERYIGNVRRELEDFEQAQQAANSTLGRFGASLTTAGDRFNKFGDGMKTFGGNMTKFVTTPILGIGAGMIMAAKESEDSAARIQNTLGLTAEEAEKLKEVSRTIYNDGFGESLEEVDTALLQTKQNMKNLNETDLEAATTSALVLAKTFDADVNEVTRAGNNLMEGFGIESSKAFDLMAHGAQNGLNFSNEMFDNLSEYSTLFGNMGFSAEEYFQLLQQGSEAGVYNLDYINDVMKEFQIRVKDGSKASTDAMAQLSDETNGVWKAFLKGDGTVKDVSNAVLDELKGMDDQVKANEIGVGLYGTKWEDLEAEAMYALGGIDGGLGDVSGSVDDMSKNLEKTFGQRMSSVLREGKEALVPLGEVMLDFSEDLLPKLTTGVEKVSNWLANMSPEAQKNAIMFAGITAAAGPLIAGLGFVATSIGGIMSVAGPLITAISGAGGLAASFGTVGTAIAAFATGPVGIGIAAIAGIGIAGGLLVNHLRKDAIPEMDRFGEGVSENTQKALGSFFDLSDGASQELMNLRINGTEVTELMADEILSKFEDMNTQILEGMKKRHADEIAEMEAQFLNSTVLSSEREAEILRQQEIRNDMQVVGQQHLEERIQQIIETAATEKRAITEAEALQIDEIRKQMNENAVVNLTQNELEQKIILERMKNTASEMSALQAAEVVKNSATQRDNVIADADKVYNDTIAFAIQQRDEAGVISAEEAQKIMDEAQKKRDTVVGHAEDMHSKVVGEAQKQAEEHVDQVDWETGEILSKWDVYKTGVVTKFQEMNEQSMTDFRKWGEDYTTWSAGVREKSSTFWRSWADGVATKFKETNSSSLGDFKRWGQNYNEWAAGVKEKANENWRQYGEGVVSRFRRTNTNSLADFKRWGGNIKSFAGEMKDDALRHFAKLVAGAVAIPGKIKNGINNAKGLARDGIASLGNSMMGKFGSVVNGLIGGVNTITGKLGIDKELKPWKNIPTFHKGTDEHKGGPMIVGDKYGREIVQFPGGKTILSPGTDTLIPNAPRGTKVIPNYLTEKILRGDIPMYNMGAGLKELYNAGKEKAGSAFKKAKGWAENVWDYATNPKKLIDMMVNSLGLSVSGLSGGASVMAKGAFSYAKNKSVDYLKGMFSSAENPQSGITVMGGNGGGFGSPFRLTSRPGPRNTGILGASRIHKGWDWAAPTGTPIPSVTNGVGYRNSWHPLSGNFVEVKSGNKIHRYQHNSKNLLRVGQPVKKGQTVGLVGATGVGSGSHLHYEVRGLETGGITNKEQLVRISEKNREEITIPMHPSRRTDAMKLLAIAGKKIMNGGKNGGITRPNQLPNVATSGGTTDALLAAFAKTNEFLMQQNQLLMSILQKDGNVYIDKNELIGTIGSGVTSYQHTHQGINTKGRGRR